MASIGCMSSNISDVFSFSVGKAFRECGQFFQTNENISSITHCFILFR